MSHYPTSSPLRGYLRPFLESYVGHFLRDEVNRRALSSASRGVLEQSNRHKMQSLKVNELVEIRARKGTDTFFILGSGASVNRLTQENWEGVGRGFSAGINHWTLHKFVPDAYFFEPLPENRAKAKSGERGNIEVDHLNHLKLLSRNEVFAGDPMIASLAPRSRFEANQLDHVPDALRKNIRLYGRITPVTRKPANLSKELLNILDVARKLPCAVVPDSGATVARLLGLAILAGFKKTVLLGVDLTNTYFWQEQSSMLSADELRAFRQPNRAAQHATVLNDIRPFGILQVIAAYREIYDARGASLLNGSSSKELGNLLRPHQWN